MFDPKVIPCDYCRTPLPADMPGKLVLGEFIGHACDACAEVERGRLRVRLLARAGVPAHFLAKLETLQKRPLPEEPWVLIQGAVGTGKTHLAVEHVLSFDDPKRVRFVDWPDFVETRKQSIGDTFCVARSTVRAIVLGVSWKHVPNEHSQLVTRGVV